MIEQLVKPAGKSMPAAESLVVEPILHYGPDRIYNTLTDRFLAVGEPGFRELHELRAGRLTPGGIPAELRTELFAGSWLI